MIGNARSTGAARRLAIRPKTRSALGRLGLATTFAIASMGGQAHAAAAAPAKPSLRFESVFSDKGQPATLHFKAEFQSRGTLHHMDVWRDGERQLKRSTDDRLETFVRRDEPGTPEFQMTVLDKPRKIITRIDRSNLYRIGNFTDWYDLAHGLKHPMGKYQLVKAKAPAAAGKPVAACAWYDLTQDQHTTHVCWDGRNRVPLLIVDDKAETIWKITALDRKAIPAATFEIHDEGYIRNDANQDMDRD